MSKVVMMKHLSRSIKHVFLTVLSARTVQMRPAPPLIISRNRIQLRGTPLLSETKILALSATLTLLSPWKCIILTQRWAPCCLPHYSEMSRIWIQTVQGCFQRFWEARGRQTTPKQISSTFNSHWTCGALIIPWTLIIMPTFCILTIPPLLRFLVFTWPTKHWLLCRHCCGPM